MALTSLRVTGSENLCLAWAGLSTDMVIPNVICGRSLGLGDSVSTQGDFGQDP